MMGILLSIQKEQVAQRTNMNSLQDMVHEIYYDPNYDNQVDDNNNNDKQSVEEDDDLDLNEPPARRKKTTDNENDKEKEISSPSSSVFKGAAHDYKTKENVDDKVNRN